MKLPTTNRDAAVPRLPKSIIFQTTNKLEIRKVIKQFKIKKSSGSNGFHNEVIECFYPVAKPGLANAFIRCTDERIIQKFQKIAKFIVVYKKRGRNTPKNYRPFTSLSLLSRISETLIQKNTMKFFETNSLPSEYQYGF